MTRRDGLFIAAGSGGLVLAYAPFPFGFLALISLAFFFEAAGVKRPWSAFFVGYLFGLIWGAGTLYWIGWATAAGAVGSVLYLACFWGVFAALTAWFRRVWGDRGLWFTPVLWTAVEILGSLGPIGFPWNALGYTQAGRPEWIQYASVTGVWGVTFWVVVMNVLAYHIWRHLPDRRFWAALVSFLLLWMAPLAHGLAVMHRPVPQSGSLRVSLVQGNLDPYVPWSPVLVQSSQEIYGRLTREAAKDRPGLVVWPEAAIPTYLDYDRTTEKWLSSYADSLGVPILTGAFDFDTNDRRLYYNAAYCIGPGIKGIPRYHKIRLVPFSERIPWVADIPFCYRLSKKYFLDLGDFTPGDTCKVFDVADRKSKFRFSSPICFDSVFPNLVSRFVLNGARFLVIITNDGWFGRTSGPYQHARIAVLRAIENRVWIARCANTGVSEFIDPQGRVAASTPIYREAVLTREIGLSAEQAWFTVHGAVVPRFFGLIALGSTALTGSRQLRSRQRSR